MSKRKNKKRTIIGKIRVSREIWIDETEMQEDLNFLRKLHPGNTMEESIQELIEIGYLSIRMTPEGKRQFTLHQDRVQAAIDKLPADRRRGYGIKIYEDTAQICDYDNTLTTLLSLVTQQTDNLIKDKNVIPWINISHEKLVADSMGTISDLSDALLRLEQRNFVELAENGPENYRYRLNVPVVQATLDALPPKDGE
jgi:hypothetical protein